MEEEAKTIMPNDRDPVKLNELMQDQKKGLEWIKQRQEQLKKNWGSRFQYPTDQPIPNQKVFDYIINIFEELSREWADLENDFNYIKDINTGIATRHEEVWDCMPSLTEIDAIIKKVNATKEDNHEFFCTGKKADRIAKLKKLRSAIAFSMGNK